MYIQQKLPGQSANQIKSGLALSQSNSIIHPIVLHHNDAPMATGNHPYFSQLVHSSQDRMAAVLQMASLTHWGRVTYICISNLTNIDSDNGLSPGRRQAIIWTNAGSLLIGSLGTNFNEILIEILTFSFKKMRLKVSSAKRRPFCLGLNELKSFLVLKILYFD